MLAWLKWHDVPSSRNRQEALLAAISEKDANIALLELSSSKKKKTQDEVSLLKREKDRLVQQLKQQVGRGKRKLSGQSLTRLNTLHIMFHLAYIHLHCADCSKSCVTTKRLQLPFKVADHQHVLQLHCNSQ